MNIVVVAAHPDDAECGCGGFILKAIGEGHKIHILTCTNGDKYGIVPDGASVPEVRECEARAAAAASGAEVEFLRYSDQELPYNEETLGLVRGFILKAKADLVLAHWPADNHPDHQVSGTIATIAVNKMSGVGLAYFEATPGGQTFGFTPNRYFDISDVVEKKKDLLRHYVSQGAEMLISIKDLSMRWHGVNMGVENAEAFYMHKPTRKSEELFLSK